MGERNIFVFGGGGNMVGERLALATIYILINLSPMKKGRN